MPRIVFVLVGVALIPGHVHAAEKPSRPNFVFLLADDLTLQQASLVIDELKAAETSNGS